MLTMNLFNIISLLGLSGSFLTVIGFFVPCGYENKDKDYLFLWFFQTLKDDRIKIKNKILVVFYSLYSFLLFLIFCYFYPIKGMG